LSRITRGIRYPDAVTSESILEVYPTLVNFTRNKDISPLEELKDYIMGLNGEVGEFTDMIKKILYHGVEYNPTALMLEMGDILYYATAISNILGMDMAEILLNNNAKLSARYKDGYSIGQSLKRIEEENLTLTK
jgi:NTP pyrophosphatase (non-canonical NTP hydrolase)